MEEAGSETDFFARLVAQKLAERWGQQVVVDDRPGAGGTFAGGIVAAAPADGYTERGCEDPRPTSASGSRAARAVPKPSTPENFEWFIRDEIEKLGKIARAAGLKPN